MQGVFLKEGEQVSVVDPETGNKKLDEMEDERQFDSAEVEERVTSPGYRVNSQRATQFRIWATGVKSAFRRERNWRNSAKP